MEARRWLLPFTHGVDMQAIDSVVSLAESAGTTLVALSLVSVPEAHRPRGARLEDIQQSKDFLEAVKWKASQHRVPVEAHEVFTGDVLGSIATLVQDLDCDSMVLVGSRKHEVMLHGHELKHLLTQPPAPVIVLRLPLPPERPPLGARFLSWLRRGFRQQGEFRLVREEAEVEGHSRSGWRSITFDTGGESRRT